MSSRRRVPVPDGPAVLHERVLGWYKEYRSLGTRHEKLGVNYVALWLVAMIERSLKLLFPNPT